MKQKNISILDLTGTDHLKEIHDGFLKLESDEFRFVDYRVNKNYRSDPVIVLGAHINPTVLKKLEAKRENVFIYNLEQLNSRYKWLNSEYASLLKTYNSFDYSIANKHFYDANNLNFNYLPVPLFDTFEQLNVDSDDLNFCDSLYDLVIFGMDTPRRRGIVATLTKAGISVLYVTNSWGKERYRALKKAKAILNLHAFDGGFLETTRLNYCVANGFPVISESVNNEPLVDLYKNYVHFLTKTDMVSEVKAYLNQLRFERGVRINQHKLIKESLGFSMIENSIKTGLVKKGSIKALSHVSNVIKNSLVYELDNLDSAHPDSGLSLNDLKHLLDKINRSANSKELLIKYAYHFLNKYPYFINSNAGDSGFWLEFLDSIKAVGTVKSRQIYKLYKELLGVSTDEGFDLKNCISNISNISEDYSIVIDGKIASLSDNALQVSASQLVDVLRIDRPVINSLLARVIFTFIKQFASRDMLEAQYRLCRYVVVNRVQLSPMDTGDLAGMLYESGDMINAIKMAKLAVDMGFDPPGIVNLSKAKVSRYPSDYSNAFKSLQESLKNQYPAKVVLDALSQYSDPAKILATHEIVSYGDSFHELYDLDYQEGALNGSVYASDKLINFKKMDELPRVKCVAIVSHYNEADILLTCVDSLHRQGFEVVILDNWSSDDHFEIVEEISSKYNARIVRYPEYPQDEFDLRTQLNWKSKIAMEYPGYWVSHIDADEVRLSSLIGFDLMQTIAYADWLGFNAIDHLVLNLRPIKDSFRFGRNPFMEFSFFEYGTSDLHRQIKVWKQEKTMVDLSTSGGHTVSFYNRKVFPLRQILLHFPLRNIAQANHKLFKERLPRFSKAEKDMGWHVHYDNFNEVENSFKLYDKYKLLPLFDFRQLINNRLLRKKD
jgi:Glycosyl transferase family 2